MTTKPFVIGSWLFLAAASVWLTVEMNGLRVLVETQHQTIEKQRDLMLLKDETAERIGNGINEDWAERNEWVKRFYACEAEKATIRRFEQFWKTYGKRTVVLE